MSFNMTFQMFNAVKVQIPKRTSKFTFVVLKMALQCIWTYPYDIEVIMSYKEHLHTGQTNLNVNIKSLFVKDIV